MRLYKIVRVTSIDKKMYLSLSSVSVFFRELVEKSFSPKHPQRIFLIKNKRLNNITDHDLTNPLKHEAYWILFSVNTRATISPESCEGKFCPFKSYEGLGFSADLKVNNTLPAVSSEELI